MPEAEQRGTLEEVGRTKKPEEDSRQRRLNLSPLCKDNLGASSGVATSPSKQEVSRKRPEEDSRQRRLSPSPLCKDRRQEKKPQEQARYPPPGSRPGSSNDPMPGIGAKIRGAMDSAGRKVKTVMRRITAKRAPENEREQPSMATKQLVEDIRTAANLRRQPQDQEERLNPQVSSPAGQQIDEENMEEEQPEEGEADIEAEGEDQQDGDVEIEGEEEDGRPTDPANIWQPEIRSPAGQNLEEEMDVEMDVEDATEIQRNRGEEDATYEPDPCPDIDVTIKVAVRKAHRNLAHPKREQFVRMLRLGGASAEAVRYAKVWTCPVCAQMAAPKLTRQAMVWPDNLVFNAVVSLDLLTVHDCHEREYNVLSIVDWASRYHTAVMLKNKSSEQVARKFCRYWVRWAGAPQKVQFDRGGEFEGQFAMMLSRLNIDCYTVPVEAAWQNGLAERQGGTLKNFVGSVVHDVSADGFDEMEFAVLEATLAKN